MQEGQIMRSALFFFLSLLLVLFLAACGGDDDETKTEKTYSLTEQGGSSISGNVTFEKVSDTETKITIKLTGTPNGGSHPAHIHTGDVGSGGAIYVSLTNVDGTSGESTTTVTETSETTPTAITYEDLIAYDGYINIHLSANDLATIVAAGETGLGQ